MKKNIIALATTVLLATSSGAMADVSTTVNITSDYTFNGVSQTNDNPALQASLDYAADDGFYVGTWASTVDFGSGENTNIEWDAYAGKYFQLNENTGLDAGIAYYTYHGDSASNTYNYPEAYAKLNYASSVGNTELNFWYSWDYFGLDGGHYITMIAHTYEVTPGHSIRASFDRSTSRDVNKWAWNTKESYNHVRLEYMANYNGYDVNLALEDTNMNIESADTRVVLSISRSFDL